MSAGRDPAADLPARLLHRGDGHQRLRPRRRHGRRQDQHRAHRRHHRRRVEPPAAAPPARLRIPLTLAIIPALTVDCAGDRYAIPQVSLLELVRLDGRAGRRRGRGDRRRAGLPPARRRCCRWSASTDVLGLPRSDAARRPRRHRRPAGRTAASSAWSSTGVIDTEEIVVKPLGEQLEGDRPVRRRHDPGRRRGGADPRRAGPGPAGAAHRVRRASQPSEAGDGTAPGVHRHRAAADAAGRASAAAAGWPSRWTTVTRLEQFPPRASRRSGNREVVQYRGAILPLVRLDRHLGAYERERPRRPRGHRLLRRAAAAWRMVVERDPRHRRRRGRRPQRHRRHGPARLGRRSATRSPSCSTSGPRSWPPTRTSTPLRRTASRAGRRPRRHSWRSDVPAPTATRARPARDQRAARHLPPRRPPLRRRGRARAGGAPQPAAHPGAARPARRRRPDQPARPGGHRARPARAARPARRDRGQPTPSSSWSGCTARR